MPYPDYHARFGSWYLFGFTTQFAHRHLELDFHGLFNYSRRRKTATDQDAGKTVSISRHISCILYFPPRIQPCRLCLYCAYTYRLINHTLPAIPRFVCRLDDRYPSHQYE